MSPVDLPTTPVCFLCLGRLLVVVPAPGLGGGKVMNCGGQLLVKRGEKMNDHGYSIWEQFVALGGAGRHIFSVIFITFVVAMVSWDFRSSVRVR